jgi:hypothetical protein
MIVIEKINEKRGDMSLKWKASNYDGGIVTRRLFSETFSELANRYLAFGVDIKKMEIGKELFIR